jgi:hypothetical protein
MAIVMAGVVGFAAGLLVLGLVAAAGSLANRDPWEDQ